MGAALAMLIRRGVLVAADARGGYRFALTLQRRWVAQQDDPGTHP